jgi:hypothetical protein
MGFFVVLNPCKMTEANSPTPNKHSVKAANSNILSADLLIPVIRFVFRERFRTGFRAILTLAFFCIVVFWPIVAFYSDIKFDPVRFTNEWISRSITLGVVAIAISIYEVYRQKTKLKDELIELNNRRNDYKLSLTNNNFNLTTVKIKYHLYYSLFQKIYTQDLQPIVTDQDRLEALVRVTVNHESTVKIIKGIDVPILEENQVNEAIQKLTHLLATESSTL